MCATTPGSVESTLRSRPSAGAGYWRMETGLNAEQTNGWLVFADPFHLDCESWLRGWNEAYAPLPVLGGLAKMSFDTAGRVTLPEGLCDMFGLSDWVVVVGLGDRFQIWEREAFQAHRAAQREIARDGLAQLRATQRAARAGSGV